LRCFTLTKGDWSERVAISQRRRVDNPTQIAEDRRAGGGLVLYRGNFPVAALSYVRARDGSWELRRLGVTLTYSGRGFTSLLIDTLEKLARKEEVRSIRIPVETYAPQYKAYFERNASAGEAAEVVLVHVHVQSGTVLGSTLTATFASMAGKMQVSSNRLSSSCRLGSRQSVKPAKLLFLAALNASLQLMPVAAPWSHVLPVKPSLQRFHCRPVGV
jgi:GNAT superfamily N-acetyltransferase